MSNFNWPKARQTFPDKFLLNLGVLKIKYFYIIFAIFPILAFSYERVIEEIGPCWISNKAELPIQVASFSSGNAFSLELDDISSFLESFKDKVKHLQNLNSTLVIKNISLHCGAYGNNLFFSVGIKNNSDDSAREDSTYCIKAAKSKYNTWSISWGLDPNYQHGHVCSGVAPQELLLNREALGDNWKEILEKEDIKNIISEWHEINSRWVKIFLTEKWGGLEKDAKKILMDKLKLTNDSSIDYEHWMNPIGDYYTFPKFKELN